MHKTQLYLENDQYLLLKDWAAKRRKSIAQLVRELIDAALKRPSHDQDDPLYDIVGMADSGLSNVSRNADVYLYGDADAVARLKEEGMVRDVRNRRKKK